MSLLKSAATVGGYTLASRLLGFVRDLLIARYLGAGLASDAFVVAFRFPNLFRRIFAEGAFNAAFVPLYAKRLEGEGEEAARRFAQEALSVLLASLVVLTTLAQLLMPVLMYILAPGFADDPYKWALTIDLSQIAFPYLIFISLTAFLSGVLNSYGRFAVAAAAPILLNLCMIAALVLSARWIGDDADGAALAGHALVWGVFVAGVLQFLMLVWGCRMSGIRFALPRPRLTPGVRRLITLGVPGAVAGSATQISIVVGTIVASLQDSAVSWLYYAERLYQLPLGMVGAAMGVVLLPSLSRALRAGDEARVHETQNRALELTALLTLPSAAAMVAIPYFINAMLFESERFTPADTKAVGDALIIFAFGLPAFVLIKVLQPGFFAREDTATPMRYGVLSLALNAAGSIALFPLIGYLGIALATSVTSWLNCAQLAWTLRARGHLVLDSRVKRRVPLIGLAALAMTAVLLIGAGPLTEAVEGARTTLRMLACLALVAAGGATFFAVCQITGAFTFRDLRASLVRG